MAFSSEFRAQIVSEYEAGATIAGLARIHPVSERSITLWLRKAGVTIRTCNGGERNLDPDEVNRLYDSGLSTYEIGRRFACSDETVRRMVNSMRPQAERNLPHPQERKEKIGAVCRKLWQDEGYRARVRAGTSTEEYRAALSAAGKANWASNLGNWLQSVAGRTAISQAAKKMWESPEYRQKQSMHDGARTDNLMAALRRTMEDPKKRRQWIDRLRCANATRKTNAGWISSSQKQLYYLLDVSGISYHEEGPDTKIGPFYVVDCVIPKQQSMTRDLIVEVQGEYWHSLPRVATKDQQKRTYVERHTEYDLLCLDELRLKSFHEVADKLAGYGIELAELTCKTDDLEIKKIDETAAEQFYSVFHYTSTIRKGAITYGAYSGDTLVAAISYSHPIRTQVATALGYTGGQVLEISRLARMTNVSCRNLASFLIACSRDRLPDTVKCLTSFSDSTYGHTGAVYKAAGFTATGETLPDYKYVSLKGRYHKKTIWDRAKRMKLSEEAYARKHDLVKVATAPKTKWVYKLR